MHFYKISVFYFLFLNKINCTRFTIVFGSSHYPADGAGEIATTNFPNKNEEKRQLDVVSSCVEWRLYTGAIGDSTFRMRRY